jgi:hypothetical protein
VAEGVNCITVGRFGAYTKPLVIVGGNCSVQGFDLAGKEVFWSVTGDNVSALALGDIDEDGQNELLVGRGAGWGGVCVLAGRGGGAVVGGRVGMWRRPGHGVGGACPALCFM